MQKTVPDYLVSTYQMLQCAFPQGIDKQEYLPLLSILYEQMSDRNLAQVIAEYTGKEYYIVLNDVYRVGAMAVFPVERYYQAEINALSLREMVGRVSDHCLTVIRAIAIG